MSLISLTLPFPHTILRPNDKSHWAKKMQHKNKLKSDWYYIGKTAPVMTYGKNIPLSIMFYAPNNRWDLDAMLSASKSGLDGLAEALGVNDKLFRPITLDAITDKSNPRVEIEIKETT